MKMEKVINVGTGSVKVSRVGTILKSSAIGSCVVVAAYDPGKKVGAMAHIMLPGHWPGNTEGKRTRYAAEAIDEMLRKMIRIGSDRDGIEVCLVGGANVLEKEDDTICADNIESTLDFLGEKRLRVMARAVGGTSRRSARLEVESGKIFYTEADRGEKLLWKSTKKTY